MDVDCAPFLRVARPLAALSHLPRSVDPCRQIVVRWPAAAPALERGLAEANQKRLLNLLPADLTQAFKQAAFLTLILHGGMLLFGDGEVLCRNALGAGRQSRRGRRR